MYFKHILMKYIQFKYIFQLGAMLLFVYVFSFLDAEVSVKSRFKCHCGGFCTESSSGYMMEEEERRCCQGSKWSSLDMSGTPQNLYLKVYKNKQSK